MIGAMKFKAAGLTLLQLERAEDPSSSRMPLRPCGMAVRLQPDVDHLDITIPAATDGYDVESVTSVFVVRVVVASLTSTTSDASVLHITAYLAPCTPPRSVS